MSYIYLQEQEGEYLEVNCLDIPQSVLSKLKNTQGTSYCSDSETESCQKFPIWDDVCTFDGKPWRGSVDVLAGGFPCQDISAAGKGAGIAGARSGLWKEYARIIDEIRPRFVFAENSPLLRTRGIGVVLEDLASLGYDARWCVLGARDVGAPHKRDRMWVLAYTESERHGQRGKIKRHS